MNYFINTINTKNKNFPALLSEIHNPPNILYYRGNIDLLSTECFGIVGTRKLTSYGKDSTEHIIQGLVPSNFTIVSGLAMGIDSIAHKSAIANGMKTIAVLGSGVDDKSIYPRTNFNLAMEILEHDGLLLSEYPSGTGGYKSNFPERNRIISGLSKGVLIVEADERSGSLITARLAMEQNRDVFAVPGNIFSARSFGSNKLIKNGARATTSAEDILDEYGIDNQMSFENSIISTKDPIQKKILDILNKDTGLSVDEIIKNSSEETPKIIAALSILEIDNKIKMNDGGKYRRI